jgi:PrtD family type I secretion system ABC transporter
MDQLNLDQKAAVNGLLQGWKRIALVLFLISGLINILALNGSLYMLQVYDRVLTSGSIPTLLALSALVAGLYLFQALFDIVRSRLLIRVGSIFDQRSAPIAYRMTLDMPRFGFSATESMERTRDVDTVRSFLTGQAPAHLLDAPWIPLYIGFVFLLHPWLGILALSGAIVAVGLTLLSEFVARGRAREAGQAALARNVLAESSLRGAELIRAMRMSDRVVQKFVDLNSRNVDLAARNGDLSGGFSVTIRTFRMLLQSALLGLGAYLAVKSEISAGAIIACSVAAGRALAPVDGITANWRPIGAARVAMDRLTKAAAAMAKRKQPMSMPQAKSNIVVDKLTVAAPSTGQVLLSEVSFQLSSGQALALIGPTSSGKTTLIRALTGVWPLLRGSVRLDGVAIDQFDDATMGSQIGYLPQDAVVLDASVADNISRLEGPGADSLKIIEAAKSAGIHELVLKLPQGYETLVGPRGVELSAGMRQRIGLARALYGRPFLLVMDEPNANLDSEGETALVEAVKAHKAAGGIAIIAAHRTGILSAVDLVAVIHSGKLSAFGPKDEVLRGGAGGRPANNVVSIASAGQAT